MKMTKEHGAGLLLMEDVAIGNLVARLVIALRRTVRLAIAVPVAAAAENTTSYFSEVTVCCERT